MDDILKKIQLQIKKNPVLLYMKGTPEVPQCGFSAKAVQILRACGENFYSIDVLKDLTLRRELPKYANWPTFPQLWVNSELIGGCDIMIEMYESGELQSLIKSNSNRKS